MDIAQARELMVENQLRARGISDERILKAFYKLPRHNFVSENLIEEAYGDYPLPIGEGQTISQPYMVALMTESLSLKGNERVLEIGTGSGYQTAILAETALEIYTVERVSSLASAAKMRLNALGYTNIYFKVGDGTLGWESQAPFDGIIVTAAATDVPAVLLRQLKERGKMVIPIGGSFNQMLTLIEKMPKNKNKVTDITPCVFVPLIGA